jgi:DNA-binding HxlR family transcriptional regulator
MRRYVANKTPCAIHGLLETLARPWTMHILWALSTAGPMRFGVLRRQIDGISSRVLTERLRALEERGFIYRDYEATIPPTVTYGITKRMRDIHRIFDELERAARKWQMEDAQPKARRATAAEPKAEPWINLR